MRAQACRHSHQLGLFRFTDAIKYSDEALKLDSKFVKALMRRATAHLELKNHLMAIDDLQAALALEPKNSTIKADLDTAISSFNESKAKAQSAELKKHASARTSLAPSSPSSATSAEEFELPEPAFSHLPSAPTVVVSKAVLPEAAAPSPAEEPAPDISVPTTPPKSFFIFEQTFSSISRRPDLLAQYYSVREKYLRTSLVSHSSDDSRS